MACCACPSRSRIPITPAGRKIRMQSIWPIRSAISYSALQPRLLRSILLDEMRHNPGLQDINSGRQNGGRDELLTCDRVAATT